MKHLFVFLLLLLLLFCTSTYAYQILSANPLLMECDDGTGPDLAPIPPIIDCDQFDLSSVVPIDLNGTSPTCLYYTNSFGMPGNELTGSGLIVTSSDFYFIVCTSGSCADTTSVDVTIVNSPVIDEIPDQNVCEPYTLPVITGINLTGNEAYYTGPGGTGTQYSAGSVITAPFLGVLYAFDSTNGCFDGESFVLNVTEPPTISIYNLVCVSPTEFEVTINVSGNSSFYTVEGDVSTTLESGIPSTLTLSLSVAFYDISILAQNSDCVLNEVIYTPNCSCPTGYLNTPSFSFCGDDTEMDISLGGPTGLTITDATNLDVSDVDGDGVDWFLDIPPSIPYIPGNLGPTDECIPNTYTLYAYLRCDANADGFTGESDDSYVFSGSIEITVYPDMSDLGGFIDTPYSCDLCVISFDCDDVEGFTISNSYDNNGACPDLSAETGAGSITWLVGNLNYNVADAQCFSFTIDGNYICVSCPTTNDFDSDESIFSGNSPLMPQINLNDENGNAVFWEFEDGSPYIIGDPLYYPASGDGCSPDIVTLHAYIMCDDDWELATPEIPVDLFYTHSVYVYPEEIIEPTISSITTSCGNNGIATVSILLSDVNDFEILNINGGTLVNLDVSAGFATLVIDAFIDDLGEGEYSIQYYTPCTPVTQPGLINNSIECTVTAIELKEFDGRTEGNINLLFWTTASEMDADYFILERSENGVDFQKICVKDAIGFSSNDTDYSYQDFDIEIGVTYYYRLIEVNTNGEHSYLGNIVEIGRESTFSVNSIYPAITNGDIVIDLVSTIETEAVFTIYAADGRLIANKSYSVSGSSSILLDVANYMGGTYFIHISNGQTVHTSKFVKY